jgi:hypothetical protein
MRLGAAGCLFLYFFSFVQQVSRTQGDALTVTMLRAFAEGMPVGEAPRCMDNDPGREDIVLSVLGLLLRPSFPVSRTHVVDGTGCCNMIETF